MMTLLAKSQIKIVSELSYIFSNLLNYIQFYLLVIITYNIHDFICKDIHIFTHMETCFLKRIREKEDLI